MIMELKPQVSLPLLLPLLALLEESSLYELSSLRGSTDAESGRMLAGSVFYLQRCPRLVAMLGMCVHMVLLLYAVRSSPSGRERAQTPAVGLWRCISLGCAVRGALLQQQGRLWREARQRLVTPATLYLYSMSQISFEPYCRFSRTLTKQTHPTSNRHVQVGRCQQFGNLFVASCAADLVSRGWPGKPIPAAQSLLEACSEPGQGQLRLP